MRTDVISDISAASDHSNDELITTNYHWLRFKWMLFRNCCKHWNNLREFLFVMLMPSICCLVVVILRYQTSVEHITATTFSLTDIIKSWEALLAMILVRQSILEEYFGTPTYSSYAPRLFLAYAPDFEAANTIMEHVSGSSLSIPTVSFSTCDELREKMSTEYYLVGICFNYVDFTTDPESIPKTGTYPNRLEYNIILPSELRRYRKGIGDTWDTTKLYGKLGPRERSKGFDAYIKEGFVIIQKMISETYIMLLSNVTQRLDGVIYIRRFPLAEHYYDPLSQLLEKRLSLVLIGAYIPSILYLLRVLVLERQSELDGMLSILDVTPFIQFYSWFIFTLASMSIGSIILLFILKIPWNSGFGVFNRSSFTCLFVVFTAFNINALSFCYMMSKFFRSSKVAVRAAPIFWILFYLPFAAGVEDELAHTFISLLGNSAFGFALENTFNLEYYNGLNWSSFFKSDDLPNNYFSVGVHTLLMCGVSVVQAIIGICVQRFTTFFLEVMKLLRREELTTRANPENTRYSKTIIYEVRASYKSAEVEVISLTVERGNTIILNDVSFSLYGDEITMLMGHNGSGKTTLLRVIAGLRRPTSGKVVFKENNEIKDYGSPRDFVGVSLTDSLLFDDLNVENQLMFFGRLKGVSSTEVKREVKKYLDALELDGEQYTRTDKLTCGQRTKLAVSCALIGGSKVVLLDDIALKLDVRDYQLIWRLLQREKFGRCILASTNLSIEPELHADNIVMLAQGRLKCSGTAQFLKSMYCSGFYLLISKADECKSDEVTTLLSKFIPDIAPACDLVRELTYHIETTNIELCESIFQELETAKEVLGIINISLIEMPVEELFCKLGAERPAYDDRRRYLRILNGRSIAFAAEMNDDLLFLSTPLQHKMNSFQRLCNQWYAMFYKFIVFYWAHKRYIPILIFTPLLCILFCVAAMSPNTRPLPKLKLKIQDYKNSETVLSIRSPREEEHEHLRKLLEIYFQFIYGKNSYIKTINIHGQAIGDYILDQQRQYQFNNLNIKIILGLSYQNHFTAWYNGYLPHMAPLTLNILHNSLLRFATGTTEPRIDVTLELLPKQSDIATSELYNTELNMGSKLVIFLSVVICYSISRSVLVLVSERSTGFESLQRLAGLGGFNYWISIFLFDMMKDFLVMSTFIVAAWALFPENYAAPIVLRWGFALLLLVSAAITSTNYFLCLFFKSNHQAYLTITTIHALGVAFYIMVSRGLKSSSSNWVLLLRIFPLYSFCNGFHNVYENNVRTQICKNEGIRAVSIAMETCKMAPNCCEHHYLEVEGDAKYLWINIGLSWFGILVYECRHFFMKTIPLDNYNRALDEHKRRHASDSYEVDSVTGEAMYVQSLRPRMRHYYTVICEKLGLIRKGNILVDRLTFALKPGEIFGIIGTNCKCTNALLNLIAGQEGPTFGRFHVNTVSMTDERSKALEHIGYVPTVNCVMPEMTCHQILRMFCILYGYPYSKINDVCEDLAKQFGFHSQYNIRIEHCSAGIKEKISYSIAILKKPTLLCVGNYSWSLDPHGRRQLYRLLHALSKQGTAVAITSVTNCYTEILCTKIAVMHDGQFLFIGPPSDIASKLAAGYFISMRMRKHVQTRLGVTSKAFFRLTTFMEKNFPSSKLVQESTIMQFFIPQKSTTLPVLFKTLHLNSFQLNIESLLITTINMNYIVGLIIEEAMRAK
ncbi:phospholipid-transporting ATPase ABCA3-like [Anastrepha ludens]|uniref:phospholipid-transporting ATPase ABCA3-like n=1 Tax=Anastrepha ludens TaxID=28586 RepID=UPI0023B14095|nr:phospholipid-transporting ATPase ABCA3-like [Anastrepha ludens]